MIDAEQINDVFITVKSCQNFDESQAILLRNLAYTDRRYGNIPEAIEHFHRAFAVDANHLLSHSGLALAYARENEGGPKPDWERAIHHCDIILAGLKQGNSVFSDNKSEDEVQEYLEWRAKWLRKLRRYDDARAIYSEILQKDPMDDENRLELIYTLCESQAYGSVVELLQELHKEVDEDTQKTSLSRFFHTHGDNYTYHRTIVQAFKRTNSIPEIKGHYRQAVADFKFEKPKQDWGAMETHCNLSYHFAAILYTQEATPIEKEEAIEVWERIITTASPDRSITQAVALSARSLAKSYIAKAIEAGKGSNLAEEMISKVEAIAPAPKDGDIEEEDQRMNLGLSRCDVRALVSRYYSAVGEVEKAREELRPLSRLVSRYFQTMILIMIIWDTGSLVIHSWTSVTM